MAAAKKKTTGKSPNRKKTQTSQNNDLVRMCLMLFIILMSIMAFMRYGVVGNFLYQLIALFFGNMTMFIIILIIAGCILPLVKFDFESIPLRMYIGAAMIFVGLLMFATIKSTSDLTPWAGFSQLMEHFLDILNGRFEVDYGLIGAVLVGLVASLFDFSGAYMIVFLLFIGGLVLIGYEWIVSFLKEKKEDHLLYKEQKKLEAPKEKKVKKQRTVPIIESTVEEKPKKEMFIDLQSLPEPEIHDSNSVFIDLDAIETPMDEKPVKKVKKTKPVEPVLEEEEPIHVPAEYIADEAAAYADYKLPKLSVLDDLSRKSRSNANNSAARTQGQNLIEILNEFGINAQLLEIHIGPSVTKFEIKPEMGVRVNRIANLQNDIKMALAAEDIRIEAPIPGKNAVGIEIPNVEKTTVQMKELMASIPASLRKKPLLFALGKDLLGNCTYGEMNRMPHLLIAGATGSGKSVCVNSIICSFLMRTRPDELKLVLIDPKKVEFTPYNDIPHLLAPVITDGDMANKALKVLVQMMDRRYDIFGELGVRNITAYNEFVRSNPDEHYKVLPRIVIIIDELADLMLVAAKEVEASIQRITQLARAAGIHLIVATQRPSVDVITGVIKANIPSRIAFAVSQAVDSRTILDQAGAERLLGYGDMLYLPNGETSAKRIQGVFIKDDEVNRICDYVKSQAKPHYDDAFVQLKTLQMQGGTVGGEVGDPLYDDVKNFVIQSHKASTSLIQRKFSIGYARAARLIDALEDNGIIGPANGSKPREVLVSNNTEDY